MNNGRPRQHGQRPTGTPSASGNRTSGEPLKFDGEFDFEQANQRFTEEIEKAMDKLKVEDNKKTGSDEKNESLTNSMSQELQDQAHIMMKQKSLETMDLAKEMQKQMDQKMLSKEEQDVKDFYDKNISFFDRISCESNEKMVSGRPKSWKEERKVNAETFGLTQRSNRSYNYNNRNYHNRNYNGNRNNNNNNNMNNSMTNSNSQNFQRNGQRQQNYNQRSGQQNMNRGYNNNGGYRQHRQEMEVNGNSQRRFGSR